MRRLVILLGLLFTALPVVAHDPYIEAEDWGLFDAPHRVDDSGISYALYGYLENGGDVDVFQLDFVNAGDLLRVELLVPVCGDHYADYYPQFAVFGRSTNPDAEVTSALPLHIPDGLGMIFNTLAPSGEPAATPTAERPTFVEPFGGTAFYQSSRYDLEVSTAGTYYVAVFDPSENGGDYTLATGYREEFNSPLSQVFSNVLTIRSGDWLHRRCDLPPGHPDAVIEHKHE